MRGPDPTALAAQLLGRPAHSLEPLGRGRNSRVFRVDCGGRCFALKLYPRGDGRGLARLRAEWAALEFLRAHGVDCVPAPVARDEAGRAAVFSFLDGACADRSPGPGDAAALAGFLERLLALGQQAGAGDIPLASEACPGLEHAAAAVARRLESFAGLAAQGLAGECRRFLDSQVRPALARLAAAGRAMMRAAGLDPAAELPWRLRVLSPSDFGLHNALRRPGGELAFVDFEYFGWDDPAKLVADTLFHPEALPGRELRQGFAALAAAVYAGDPDFAARLEACRPLHGLKWCLILLREFLPRESGGRAANGDEALLRGQLDKARDMLAAALAADRD